MERVTLESKIIKGLDGKERIFDYNLNENNEPYFYYNTWKNNQRFGPTQVIRSGNVKKGKFPKHTTKEMLMM